MTAYLHALDPSGNLVPLHVDASGNLKVDASVSIDAVTVDNVEISNDIGNPVPVTIAAGTAAIGKLGAVPGLDIPAHDHISLSYTGADLTGVVYKTGGSGGTTVATLTLAYTSGNLTSVTKS